MPGGLAELATVVDQLAAQDLDRLAGSIRVQRARRLRWLIDRLEGQRLK